MEHKPDKEYNNSRYRHDHAYQARCVCGNPIDVSHADSEGIHEYCSPGPHPTVNVMIITGRWVIPWSELGIESSGGI